MKFRPLRADEIEIRVGTIKKDGSGLSLLLYKDARCDMNILDETFGAENWQRDHYECKGNLFCRVGIYFPYPDFENVVKRNICGDGYDAEGRTQNILEATKGGQWIWKADCGTESNTEKEKGEASDSFKRACVNWGIGRELYTAPFIWVSSTDCKITQFNNKQKCNDDFVVTRIAIDNGKIVDLEIYNNTLKRVVYKMNGKKPKTPSVVTCPKCGKPMQPMKTAKGTVWQPQQILSKYGMCKDCYEASNK